MGFSNDALRYAELGYRIFPCTAGTKYPCTTHGCKDATTDEEQIATWWSTWPHANIGISTDGLVVVDVDPLTDGSRNQWDDEIDRLADLVRNAQATTPRGGRHYWFRQPDNVDIRNSVCRVAPGVDIRATGGYVVAPPSRTRDGLYQWAHGFELTVGPDRLSPLPQWLVDLAKQEKLDGQALLTGGSDFPAGERNQRLTSIGGYLRRAGFSERSIAATLREVNDERCKPPLGSREVAQIAWSVSRYEPEQVETAVAEGWAEADPGSEFVPEPGDVPADLLQPGGFLGEVMAWNLETAFKPQPELALGGALTLLATLIGRKRQDWSRTRTNLYVLAVAKSGYGKEHARKISKSVLAAVKAETLLGAEEFGSAQGLVRSIEARPVLLFQCDEFGRFLKTTQNASKSPWLFQVLSTLMKLYTSSDSLFLGSCVADVSKTAVIQEPHACLYATSTPAALTSALTPDAFEDGFLGRFIVVSSPPQDKTVQPTCGIADVPKSVLDIATKWMQDEGAGGNLGGVTSNPLTLMAGPGAADAYAAFEAECQHKRNRELTPAAPLWARAGEKARKLGLLHALSLDIGTKTVGEASAMWGVDLARHLSEQLEWLAGQYVARTPYESDRKAILRIVTDSGATGITLSGLSRKAGHLRARERSAILEDLQQAGEIVCEAQSTGGRKALVYKAAQNSQA